MILARVIPPYEPAKDRPVLNALFIGSILAVCALTFPSREKLVGLMASKYPVQTAAYLRSHPSLRPIFNRTEWGGFLMHSGLRVFINTQSDIFEYTGVLADYFAMIEPTSDEEALLRRYAIRACLLEKETPLAEFLERFRGGYPPRSLFGEGPLREYARFKKAGRLTKKSCKVVIPIPRSRERDLLSDNSITCESN